LFNIEIPDSLKSFLQRLISLSHIPEEFHETAMKCLFELLLQPQNFRNNEKNDHEKNVTQYYKFSVHRLASPFLTNHFKQTGSSLESNQDSSWNFTFATKKELFEFILRQNKMTKKYEEDLKKLRKWDVDDEASEEAPVNEMFNEECILVLPAKRSNIMEEIRRTIEKTDQFVQIPQQENDLDIDSEIQRLNFGGMPVKVKCLGEQVEFYYFFNF
jgi:hypothetical protein